MANKMTGQPSSKVPQIRFKGFEGEWEDQTLGKLFPITSAARVHKHEWTKSGVPFFRSSDVVSAFKGKVNTKAFISHDLYLDLSEKVGRVKKGDMLITGGGSIGIPYLVETDDPLYFKDADLLWFKIRDSVDSRYLFTFFSSQPFGRYVKSISHIGTIAHYTVEQAKITPLAVPRINTEQTKIGTYFRELDSLIGLHQRKHDKLVTLKQVMLQKMFPQAGATTPEIRFKGFSGDWTEKKLGEVMAVGSVKRIHQSDWTKTGVRFLRARDIVSAYKNEDPADVLYISQSKYDEYSFLSGKVELGDLLVTGVGTIGIPYLIRKNDPVYFKDGNIIWFKNNGTLNGYFFYYSFIGERIQNYIKESAGTGTVGTYTISSGKDTPLTSPLLEEQKIIGTYFRKLDELISKHATQLQKLKKIKSACLEKMFV